MDGTQFIPASDTAIHDPLGYRELARSLLAFQADKCINHASLRLVHDDAEKRAFHNLHANKHAEQALKDAQEWWKHGTAHKLFDE